LTRGGSPKSELSKKTAIENALELSCTHYTLWNIWNERIQPFPTKKNAAYGGCFKVFTFWQILVLEFFQKELLAVSVP
jgi:hypothetical protein